MNKNALFFASLGFLVALSLLIDRNNEAPQSPSELKPNTPKHVGRSNPEEIVKQPTTGALNSRQPAAVPDKVNVPIVLKKEHLSFLPTSLRERSKLVETRRSSKYLFVEWQLDNVPVEMSHLRLKKSGASWEWPAAPTLGPLPQKLSHFPKVDLKHVEKKMNERLENLGRSKIVLSTAKKIWMRNGAGKLSAALRIRSVSKTTDSGHIEEDWFLNAETSEVLRKVDGLRH